MNNKLLIETAKHACDSIWIIRDMFQFKLFCRKDINIEGFTPSDNISNGNFSYVNIFPFLQDTSMNFNVIWEDFKINADSDSEAVVDCEHDILITQSGSSKEVKVFTKLTFVIEEATPLIRAASFSSPDFTYSTENSKSDSVKPTMSRQSLENYYHDILENVCDLFIDCDMSEYVLRYNQQQYHDLFEDNTYYTNPDRWFWNMSSKCVHPEDYDKIDIFRKVDMDKRARNNITTVDTSFRIKNSTEGYIWVSLKVITKLSKDNEAERIAMVFRKVSSLNLTEVEYLEKSRRDSLTGLYNKAYGEYLINSSLENYLPSSTVAFVLVDIDNFHMVNDTFGHMTGDEILKQFARSFESFFGQGNVTARAGSDKFFTLLNRFPSEYEITKSIDNFLKSMRRTHYESGASLDLHCSAGIVFVESNSQTFKHLYNQASGALASAKERGKNCFVIAN